MKRFFIQMLSIMAAVLLATSCGKDDNDGNVVTDDVVDNGTPQTETVTNGVTTITVTGKTSQASLSKVYVDDNTARTLKFKGDGSEVFVFGTENEGSGWGTVTIDKDDGHYTATLHFPTGKETDFLEGSYTAELNKDKATLPAADGGLTLYDDLPTAVQNAYYTIDFKVTKENGSFKLKTGETDIMVYVKSAFIRSLRAMMPFFSRLMKSFTRCRACTRLESMS